MNAADWNAADWNVLQAAAVVAAVCVLAAGIMVGLGRRAARGLIGPRRLTLELDADDFDAVQTAIVDYCRPANCGGVPLSEWEPALTARVLAGICRDWLHQKERNARR